jgi:hypothetical protein
MIPQEEVERICRERLEAWGKRLAEAHATPVLLLGVGHDHRSGEAVLVTTEDMPEEHLREIVSFLFRQVWLEAEKP